MSGINPNHNKFYSCEGCPDRTIKPINCHSVCRGYLYRKRRNEEMYRERAEQQSINMTLSILRSRRYRGGGIMSRKKGNKR